jgi:hypothetical protein
LAVVVDAETLSWVARTTSGFLHEAWQSETHSKSSVLEILHCYLNESGRVLVRPGRWLRSGACHCVAGRLPAEFSPNDSVEILQTTKQQAPPSIAM